MGDARLNMEPVTTHQLHFIQLLEKHLIIQSKGDQTLAAIRFGTAMNFIITLSE